MKSYTIKSGDTLSKIAKQFGLTLNALLEVNPQIKDKNAIAVGQIISVPDGAVTPPAPPPHTAPEVAPSGTLIADLLARARSVLGKKVKYKLGAGGMTPTAPTPVNIDNACDCSGFVSWCFGRSRKTDHPLYMKFNSGWINTDSMVNDAKKETGFFRQLAAPRVGCIIVFPGPPLRKIGHVGIVTEVSADGTAATKVIHCSNGNFKSPKKDAVQETPPNVFNQPDRIYAWFEGLED